MTLTSIHFLTFLLAILTLSIVIGRRRRWLVLLIASYAYYATWNVPYLLVVLAAVTLSSFLCGIAMEREPKAPQRRRILWLGLAFNLVLLVALKYTGFLTENANAFVSLLGLHVRLSTAHVFISLGVSYYVLQVLSYLLDIQDGVVVAERHLGRYALHIAFFPKLLQGPIERAESLLPQLRDFPPITVHDVAAGAQLFFWGMFQKAVVADRLAPFVSAVFDDIHRYTGVPVLVATYFFAAQIYFDFAGYTDMALGAARLFGIRLTPNFNSPYLATSVADFWRRWHISFSSWLLDYVFRPLQLGLRDWRTWGTPTALLVTFLVTGLWHGATWCFVTWGLLHGIYLGTGVLWRSWQKQLHRALRVTKTPLRRGIQMAVTFHLVCVAWIFFRASTLGDAVGVARYLASGFTGTLAQVARGQQVESMLFLNQGRGNFLLVVALLAAGAVLRTYFRSLAVTAGTGAGARAWWQSIWLRTVVYAVMFYLIAFFGTATQSFIYQQF